MTVDKEILHKEGFNDWLTTGKTYLIQKGPAEGPTPGNYVPIGCLPNV